MADDLNRPVSAGADTTALPETSAEDNRLLRQANTLFIGSFQHSVDAKGRMVVPQSFRPMLGDRFYIAPTHDFSAVALYPELEWARLYQRYAELDDLDMDVAEWLEQFTTLSYRDQECDGQGRILLPSRIRELLLGDAHELYVNGAGRYVKIIPEEQSNSGFAAFRGRMPQMRQNLTELRRRERMLREGNK